MGPFAFGKGASFFLTAHTAARVAGHAAHVRRITRTLTLTLTCIQP